MNKFKNNLLLPPSEQLSAKYFSIFALFIKLFSKMSDTTQMVFLMKWVTHFIQRQLFLNLFIK